MTRKTKLMLENISLKARVAELEEKICPCEQHDYIKIDYEFFGGTGRGDETTIYKYKCRKCGKRVSSWKILDHLTEKGGEQE